MPRHSKDSSVIVERDIARAMAFRTGRTIKECAFFARAFLDSFADFALDGATIRLQGYFILDRIKRKEYTCMNLQSPDREQIVVPAHTVPRIRLSPRLYVKGEITDGEAGD